MHPAVAGLPLVEKGLVLGALLARTPPDAFETRARVLGPTGGHGRAALEALAAATRPARAATVAELIALVRAPIPAGLARIHPGWLRERLAPEPTWVLQVVTDGLGPELRDVASELVGARGAAQSDGLRQRLGVAAISRAGVAALRRRVFAGLVPMDAPGAPTGPVAAPLMKGPLAAVRDAIAARGAEMLGCSLRGAPAPVVARAAANLGPRLAPPLLDAAARPGPPEARATARRLVEQVAAERSSDLAAQLGLRALAAALVPEGDAAAQAVAQRLSPPDGRHLLALVAGATVA